MTTEKKYKIDYIEERTVIKRDGTFEKQMEVGYSVPNLGTYTVNLLKEGFTKKKAEAAIEKEVTEILALAE